MDTDLESAMRETMERHHMNAADQDAVVHWFRARDGDDREEVLLSAIDDGILEVVGFKPGYGPVYLMPH